jgi:hypothetical protein
VHVKTHPKASKAVRIRICDGLKRKGGNLQNWIRARFSHQFCYTRLYKPGRSTLEPSFVALCAREHNTTTFFFLSLPGINFTQGSVLHNTKKHLIEGALFNVPFHMQGSLQRHHICRALYPSLQSVQYGPNNRRWEAQHFHSIE